MAERLFSLISEDRMSEQAKTSEEARRASENERSHYVLPFTLTLHNGRANMLSKPLQSDDFLSRGV